MTDSNGSRSGAMTLGRSFLLWLLGVLVVTLVLVSALVLWHEQSILEDELYSRAELLAYILGLAAADGDSPEYSAIISMADVRAGEVRNSAGAILWRYGPALEEVEPLDASLLRIEREVQVGKGQGGDAGRVDVVLLVSQARVRANLASSAVRLLAGLGMALTIALVAGLALIGRVVRPLHHLADWVRTFDPDQPAELTLGGSSFGEVRDLSRAFSDMARRLTEQRSWLVASERRFRGLFTASPTPLLRLDRKLQIRDSNPAAETFLGSRSGRAIGSSLAAFVIRPELGELTRVVADVGDGAEAGFEADWRLADGGSAEVELRIGWAGDGEDRGYLVAIHDLTDRIRRMGERWRRTFDAMVDGVALVDPVGKITLANHALAPHQTAVGVGLGARLDGRAPTKWRAHSVGRLLECSLSAPKGLEDAILVVRDVTEAVDAEERLRAAEKMQAVGTLASGVAHDFNNLLAAILLHVRLLQRQPEASPGGLAAIRDLAQEGTEVVHELLYFARREGAQPTTMDLVELVRLQEGVLSHLLPAEVELVFDLEAEAVPVVGDAVGLRRLLLNLVINARDAIGEDGGRITVRVEHTAGRAVLEVEDDGPGIPTEALEHIFEPFFTLRRQGRGSGLGLAVVYSIVSTHDGDVDVRSVPGERTRFVIRLPLGEVSALEAEAVKGADRESTPRVLLVESDGRMAATMVEALAGAGLEVRHAPSLGVADDLVARWQPTVVVLANYADDDTGGGRLQQSQCPVLVLADDGEDIHDRWGPQALQMPPASTPDEIIGALRKLGFGSAPPFKA